MADMQEENPNISESWFVKCYVNRLREGIKYQLRPLRPASLTEAHWQAREMEPCYPPKKYASNNATNQLTAISSELLKQQIQWAQDKLSKIH